MHELQENLGLVTGIFQETNPHGVLTTHTLFEQLMYVWNILFLLSQISHQVDAIANPKTDEQVNVNILYSFMSLMITLFLILSYKYKKPLALLFASIINSTRMGLRLWDFENTKSVMTEVEWSNLTIL